MKSPYGLKHVESVSLYIHVPFCKKKCTYCGFHSRTGGSIQDFRDSVLDSLSRLSVLYYALGEPLIHTVYIGGGTPSVLDEGSLRMLLDGVRSFFRREPLEWTVEANPESVEPSFLNLLVDRGVRRLSVGVQTFNPSQRRVLGRLEPREGLIRSLEVLKKNWPGALNLDLITGVPGGTLESTLEDLRLSLSFSPDHLSLYSLGVEDGTPLKEMLRSGEVSLPEDSLAEEMWFASQEFLSSAGYRRYEVSNYAADGRECLHNLAYWRLAPYIGCGPSGVSTLPGENGPLRLTQTPAGSTMKEEISGRDFLMDHLLMGLRALEGIPFSRLEKIFFPGVLTPLTGLIESWKDRGLLSKDPKALRMTDSGLAVLDSFLREASLCLEEVSIPEVFWPLSQD